MNAEKKRNENFEAAKDIIAGINDEAERVRERVLARKKKQEEKKCLIS